MPRLLSFALALIVALPCAAQPPATPRRVRAYKTVGTDSPVVHIFLSAEPHAGRAAVVLFHAGGFVWGGPEITDGSAAWYAAQGLVAFSVQYRLADRTAVTPLEQLADTYDAIRWVRSHAKEYDVDVDADRGAAHGVSNALVLCSPGVGDGSGDDPYLTSLLLGRAATRDISPVTHIRSAMPPTIIISGQYDSVTYGALARGYCDRLRAAKADTDGKVTAFLKSIGYVAAKP